MDTLNFATMRHHVAQVAQNIKKSFAHKGASVPIRKVSNKGREEGAAMTACHVVGHPVWTPRHYEALANAGYVQNVIVFRCVNLIAKSLSSIHWLLYEQRGGNDYEVDHHPLLNLLRSPSKQQAGAAFLEQFFSQLLLSGNGYIEAILDHDHYPHALQILRSDRMNILVNEEGKRVGFEYTYGRSKKVFHTNEKDPSLILHIKTFNPLNDWYGMSPIEAAARAIDQHNAVGEHNLSILQNGGRPSGALLIKPSASGQTLTQSQRESLRHDLKLLYEGTENAGRIMVLEGNCEWKEMGLSPKDLDFHGGKNMSAREIAQAFGVPPILVGLTEDATFSNYKEARLNFWEDTLLPMLDSLVAEFNMWLVPFFNDALRLGYDQDSIPALAAKRDYVWSKIQEASFLTVNEKRYAVGYGPIECGDRL